jgi:1-acyl-sn-glycerol-3-phosphate acyltransferase
MTLYQFGQAVCRLYLNALFKVRIYGKENIPDKGAVLLCANHISNNDPPLLGAYIKRPVRYMAKKELFKVPVLKTLLRKLGAFPVNRAGGDKQSLRTSLDILKSGDMVGIFPEGTRSKTGEIGKGLSGAGFFALKSTAHVVPCAIIGPYKMRGCVTLVYGKPISMEEHRANRTSAKEVTEIIMDEIQKLKDQYQDLS